MDCVDLFAGLGGQSTGAVLSGHRVLWAANHWSSAVEFHAANHPETIHSCQDLQQADFSQVPDHDVGLASPCCQGHTHARGKNKPVHDNSRSTAWAVVGLAEMKRPPYLVIENVPEFLNWILFPAWEAALTKLGYSLSPHILDAADYGVPQNRVRMFMIASLSKNPIQLDIKKEPHLTARDVIDFDTGSWSQIYKDKRSQATINRIENGRKQLKTDTFLAPYYGSGSGLTGRSLDRPIGTITTKDRWALVQGDRMRMLTVDEKRKFMSFPDGTILPKAQQLATHLLGNAVAPELERRVLTALEKAA